MNRYSESDNYKRDISSSRVGVGSVIHLKWPSGNSEAIRFHGFSIHPGKIRACNMSWDDMACETYDLSNAMITKITTGHA